MTSYIIPNTAIDKVAYDDFRVSAPNPPASSDATTSAQVTASVSVSVQLRTSRLSINFVIEQTAHLPAVSTSVPALEICVLPPVRFLTAQLSTTSYIITNTAID
jgi:hypothetical protein